MTKKTKKLKSNSNQPMSTGEFFWLKVLYAIPIIGTIFMFIYAFDDKNPTRRNFTRSYFIPGIIFAALVLILLIFALVIYGVRGWPID